MTHEVDQGKRGWKIERQPGDRKFSQVNWQLPLQMFIHTKTIQIAIASWWRSGQGQRWRR